MSLLLASRCIVALALNTRRPLSLHLKCPHTLSFLTRCSYEGEEGIDAGGVFKDWLGSISRELLKPGALFLPCLSASGLSVRCLRLNPLPSELGVANEAHVRALNML